MTNLDHTYPSHTELPLLLGQLPHLYQALSHWSQNLLNLLLSLLMRDIFLLFPFLSHYFLFLLNLPFLPSPFLSLFFNPKKCSGRAEEPVPCAGNPAKGSDAASGRNDTESCPGRTGGSPAGKEIHTGRAGNPGGGDPRAGDTGSDAGFFVTDRMRTWKGGGAVLRED